MQLGEIPETAVLDLLSALNSLAGEPVPTGDHGDPLAETFMGPHPTRDFGTTDLRVRVRKAILALASLASLARRATALRAELHCFTPAAGGDQA